MERKTVGIIGDGQLGMLLCEAAPALGIDTVLLTSDADCPAAQRASVAVEGAMDDPEALATLIERCDVITYEREDVPRDAIASLRRAEAAGLVECRPPLHCIELLQDKVRQKLWYSEHGLATLPFTIVDGSREALLQAAATLGYPLVQKAPRGGFDGRGVQLLRTAADLDRAWPGETLIEKYAGNFREIAVLVVRARDGASTHFGPVAMTFESDYSVLDTVAAPADLDAATTSTAQALAHRAIDAMGGVGVFGVEMFLLDSGDVLINEISPRVHNAGHYSLDACRHSQFELHLRAVLGMPLVDTSLERPAAMKNLLCTPALRDAGRTHHAEHQALGDGAVVHWYGKSPARLMRKLGHITASAATATAAMDIVEARWQAIQEEAANS